MTNENEERLLRLWQGAKDLQSHRIKFLAQGIMAASEAYVHEREVILPAEELFAQKHGMTAQRLESDWAKRRRKQGWLCNQGAELRDKFYEIVDTIAAEAGKNYEDYIHEVKPSVFMSAFKAKTNL